MCLSSRFKLTTILSLLLIFVVGLALFSSTRLTTHAVATPLKLSTKLGAVSSPSTLNCGAWNIISSPSPGIGGNVLNGVAAISTNNIWAVGLYQTAENVQALIEQWNGTSWNTISGAGIGSSYSYLNGVARIPGTSQLLAVGGYQTSPSTPQTLIEHWDGTSWSMIPSPNPGISADTLQAVTAISASNAWAVGYYQNNSGIARTLIEHWNGTSWNVVPSPSIGSTYHNYLFGVAAISTKNVWAVGYYAYNRNNHNLPKTIIEHWNGVTWRVVSSPNPGVQNYLYGVTQVPGSKQLWAVGFYEVSVPNGPGQTLTERWNGKSWSAVSSPNPGASTNSLYGVTAISTSNAWAVGSYFNDSIRLYQTLIEHWDGTRWSVVSSPNIAASANILFGVAQVPGTSPLWTVGYYYGSNNPSQTLTEFYC